MTPLRPWMIEALAAALPLALAAALWAWRRPDARRRTGMLLSAAWLAASLPPLNALAAEAGWWRFGHGGAEWARMPPALLAGWVVAWALLPALAARAAPAYLWAAGLVWLDVLLMPRLAPVLVLGDGWPWGEALLVGAGFLPAWLLGRWTAEDRRLPARAALQVAAFAALVLGVLPDAVEAAVRAGWTAGWMRFAPLVPLSVAAQVIAVPALLGIGAVHEFAVRGRGTPLPFDPPRRLVRSGPYAYVANPMQLAMALVLVLWGAMQGRPWMVALGLMSVVYSAGLAAWDEAGDLERRFGAVWAEYRQGVRAWRPRWRPWHPSLGGGAEPARLYVARGCDLCSELGAGVERLRPVGLEIVDAEDHPSRRLTRITYDPRDGGAEEEGVAAFARALEHVNLAFALLGMAMRLPCVRWVLQVVLDASGGAPREVAWRGGTEVADACGCASCPAPRRPRATRLAHSGLIALGG
ncbi:MAG TPA: hypothetical protein VFJ82_11270 [Longimicrobium sp.]|nr:hypothetical protein [Longimicrobium sp.]